MDSLEAVAHELAQYIRSKRPDDKDLEVTSIEMLPVGFSYETYLITVSWRGHDGMSSEDMVVRKEPAQGLIPPYDVRPQFELLKRLGGSGIPVPEVYWLEPTGTVLGRPFFIMERIYGETMFAYSTRYPQQVPSLREQMVNVIADLHELDWKSLGLGILGVPAHSRDHAEREIVRWEREFKKNELVPYPLMAELFRYLKSNVPRAERTCFCHCDVQPANILVNEGRMVALLDWELATVGDPLADLGWSCATIEKFFGPAWNEDDAIRRQYEARMRTSINDESLRFWKVFAFVKGITMVFTGLRAGIELAEPKLNLLGLYPINMGTFPDAAAKLLQF